MQKSEFYSDARDDLTGPLAGVRVVEATTTWAGPMAGCMLADFGATVIKVEHPAGEVIRRLPPTLPDSYLFLGNEMVNRNKQNITVDLHKPEGVEIFLKLGETADIVIENFRPGTMASWGVGYEAVKRRNPAVVYVSISGFGQFGPLSDRVGYDPIAQFYSGWAAQNGEIEGLPVKAGTFLCDDLAGVHGAISALAALHHARATGEGQHVDVALVDAIQFQSDGYLTAGALGMPLQRWGSQFAIAAPVNRYACTDGYVYAGVLLDTHWQRLADIMERPDLKTDERYATNLARVQPGNREDVDGFLSEWCATRSTAAVESIFETAGIPATRVNTFTEVAGKPHTSARDMLQATKLSDGSVVPLTGPAAKFSRTPTRIRSAAPPLGQHTSKILLELGYGEAEIYALSEKHVV
ncbi:MAG: CoA transferase [Gammaproteobacteria bacterium]|nr:CoA transferase [Gammaproteobacteria bacterium]MCZ6770448.1 CoA transferase [Pseudomonadota bacterium]